MRIARSEFMAWAVLLAAVTTLVTGCGKKDDPVALAVIRK
jgi:hypothetical protein